jgi:hypothetical protein
VEGDREFKLAKAYLEGGYKVEEITGDSHHTFIQ